MSGPEDTSQESLGGFSLGLLNQTLRELNEPRQGSPFKSIWINTKIAVLRIKLSMRSFQRCQPAGSKSLDLGKNPSKVRRGFAIAASESALSFVRLVKDDDTVRFKQR